MDVLNALEVESDVCVMVLVLVAFPCSSIGHGVQLLARGDRGDVLALLGVHQKH